MGYEIAKLGVQSSSAAYTPLKDMFSWMNDKAKYVSELEDNLTKLTAEMTTFYSRKKTIDRILETSVSKEKSGEYHILLIQYEAFYKKFIKFINKYHKHCKDLPNAMPEDASTAGAVILALQERKPTILTRKFFTLANLSRDISKLHDHISRVTERMKPENVMQEKEVQPVNAKHDVTDLPSFTDYVNEVLNYLREDENVSIGIVGPIGVGKTTVMKKLNNQLRDTSSLLSNGNTSLNFDIVIWIDYPKHLAAEDKIIEMMQEEIIGRLKLNRERAQTVEENADIISKALGHKKYILLIDQVSSTIDLNELGIRGDHKFPKVVVASISNKVVQQMTDQQVKMRPLSNDDALYLFQKICGTICDIRIKDIADKIIESCGGLPLVIKLVATHLKGEKDENVWSDVKRMLQSETAAKLLKLGGVGNAYKLLYDGLEESYMKKCLLFGALFPADYKIFKDYLVECWMAESFLPLSHTDIPEPRSARELRSARERGATVLKELTDKYLLEWCTDEYVKMPVYFRKVALEQQYPNEENCVIWVPEKNKVNAENWKTTTRVSLISCKPKLHERPESHNISTLLLQSNPELITLGDLFFLNMKKLRVLDLNQTGIESLPISISSLVNLVSLYLNDCSRLAKLPPEVKLLKSLELLDIRGTSIHGLPNEIGDMLNLRCLRVSFAQKGCKRNNKGKEVDMMITRNIISRLKKLEELTIEMGCCSQGWNNIADQIADELASLAKLSTLVFHFPSVCSLEKFVAKSKSWGNTETHWKNNTFRSFKIFIGCCETLHPYGSYISGPVAERQLRFSTNEEISSVKEVLRQASAFELVGHLGVKSLSEFGLENTGTLKVCVIERCNNLLSIVDADKTDEMATGIMKKPVGGILQCLEKLHLFDLQLLQSIWKGSVFRGGLSNLKDLTLCGCPELTQILDLNLAKALSNLEHLKVENCSKVVEIVEVETYDGLNISEHANPSDILQKVKAIELVNLPELQSICRSTSMKWNSLKEIVIERCSKLRSLSLTLSDAEKLETIWCEESWWTELKFPEEEKQHFHHRCKFIVVEQRLAIGANSEGESSRGLVNVRALDNIDSRTYNDEHNVEGVIQRNDSSNDLPTSNKDAGSGADSLETEIGAEKPGDKMLCQTKFGSASHLNAPVESESLSLQEEILCGNGSANINSLEISSLMGAGEQILSEMVSSN